MVPFSSGRSAPDGVAPPPDAARTATWSPGTMFLALRVVASQSPTSFFDDDHERGVRLLGGVLLEPERHLDVVDALGVADRLGADQHVFDGVAVTEPVGAPPTSSSPLALFCLATSRVWAMESVTEWAPASPAWSRVWGAALRLERWDTGRRRCGRRVGEFHPGRAGTDEHGEFVGRGRLHRRRDVRRGRCGSAGGRRRRRGRRRRVASRNGASAELASSWSLARSSGRREASTAGQRAAEPASAVLPAWRAGCQPGCPGRG